MHTHLVPALALVALAATAPAASGTHFCAFEGTVIEIAGLAYVAIDRWKSDPLGYSAWVYCESNGIPGLQRSMPPPTFIGDPSACNDIADPDHCPFL